MDFCVCFCIFKVGGMLDESGFFVSFKSLQMLRVI